jgi:hypothetical protein
LRPGQIERRTHDCERHGTTSLFAGRVIGRCYKRHRAVEFRRFLAAVEQAVPADFEIHLVLDNYLTHKAPPVKAWLARHPRYHLQAKARGTLQSRLPRGASPADTSRCVARV